MTKEEKIKKLEAIKGKLNSQEAERLDYIIKNIDSYPDTLIDLVARNHETVDFVYSYKDREKYNIENYLQISIQAIMLMVMCRYSYSGIEGGAIGYMARK